MYRRLKKWLRFLPHQSKFPEFINLLTLHQFGLIKIVRGMNRYNRWMDSAVEARCGKRGHIEEVRLADWTKTYSACSRCGGEYNRRLHK